MIKKFKCNECKHRFDADDGDIVECPHCHSDNVEYSSFHIPSNVWKIVGGIIIIVGIVCTVLVNRDRISQKGRNDVPTSESDSTGIDSIYIAQTGACLPPEIEVGALDFKDNGYTFEVKVKNLDAQQIYFVVLDPYNDNIVVAKSGTGHFEGVPYSKADGGIYTLAAFDAKTDTILCRKEEITGFIRQKSVSKKMIVQELQEKIDKQDPSLMGVGENDYISPDYTLAFVGLSKNVINKPENLYDVFEKIEMGAWTSVKVVSLGYDDMNRISNITLKVQESNDNF